jgi:serine/threonine-protein kinase/endoribonuclease IRE1
MRRPPGETVANKFVFALVILLVPWLVDAQQQQNQVQSLQQKLESPHEAVGSDAFHTLEATRVQQARQVETPISVSRRKSTLSNKQEHIPKYDVSAIATLAPAISAVGAPPARRSTTASSGVLPQQVARSLEDWEVENFVLLATVDGKLYARDRKTGKEIWTLEVDKPIIETTHHRRNRSVLEDDYRPIDDYLWVVEPSNDGRLFVYFGGGKNPGLVNTGLTMKKLVEEMSPYADEDPPVVYTGEKKTTMVTLDARNGDVIKWFGSGGAGAPNNQSCRRPAGLADPECSTRGTLTLGRTEYTVNIHGFLDGHEIATLKYSEWGPNNYDHDLHRQYRKTLDSKYVLSNHDGGIFAYDHTSPKETSPIFKQKFPYPVARVFDVARPWGTENEDPELLILPQPVPPLDDENLDSIRSNRIFLNHTEDGSWYAMSGSSYPLVAHGPEPARCENIDYWRHGPLWEDMNDAQLSMALVGLHSIEGVRQQRPTISGPINNIEDDTVVNISSIEPETLSITQRLGRLPSTATSSLLDFVNNPIMTIVIVLLILLYNKELVKWVRSNYKTKVQPMLEPSSSSEDLVKVPQIDGQLPVADGIEERAVEVLARSDSLGSEPDETTGVPKMNSSIQDDGSLGPEGSADTPQPTPKKRKTHRGTRGGVKHQKNRRNTSASDDSGVVKGNASVEDAVRDAQKLGEPSKIEPDVQTLPNGVTEVSGPILRLNSLEVNTEKLIGTGSNGTMVFEGKFDGRDVAVKRMLIQFFDIASQETKLLRESDDHPNGTRIILCCCTLLTIFSNSIFCTAAKRRLSLHCTRTLSRVFGGCN